MCPRAASPSRSRTPPRPAQPLVSAPGRSRAGRRPEHRDWKQPHLTVNMEAGRDVTWWAGPDPEAVRDDSDGNP
ncbi:conserved hypothetical protein [Frankia sp. Hr75.2]|nr:conserved hypothetical protein [Frankia sp. Hr75.2]